MTTPSPSSRLRAARALLTGVASRGADGEALDIERCVAERPDLAPELRDLHAGWLRVDRLLASLRDDSARLESAARAAAGSSDLVDADTLDAIERLSRPERARTRYEVLERIGAGGMGEVWRVHDRDLGRDLAMKVIRARSSSGAFLRRFLAEARLTARLDHPGIVPVHDVGVDAEGRLWFTMPLVRGLTLAAAFDLAREQLDGWTRSRALEALVKVCDTMAFAHAVGVVHRDLKPSNVMVGRFGEAYVVDWGLARVSGEKDGAREGDILGTPAYMAPEQALGREELVGARADVYSVGAILYHLLAGERPYGASGSSEEVLAAVRAGPPDPIEAAAPDAPPELAAICRQAMARDPSDRYGEMRDLAEDLRAWMEGRVVRAHERGAWPELRKWVARNRGLAVALGAAILTAIGGLAAVSWVQAAGKAEILRLADVRRLADLEGRAEELWPAVPDKADAMERWLVDARALHAHLAIHADTLRGIAGRSLDDAEDRWRRDVLSALVERLSALGDPDPSKGLIASVRARLDSARTIRARSLEEPAAAWAAAVASIADERESPTYAGLRLAPQIGLVPIGRDPRSGLWEFAQLASGAPARRATDGTLILDADTGLVLVLVPGGSFEMGSDAPIPGRASEGRTDALARENELPAHPEIVEPFFVSKHEMTRAQWLRTQGGGRGASDDGLLPIGGVSWPEADRALRHIGLLLPSEVQWEYAARALTATRWWVGNDPRGLVGAANGGSGIDVSLPYDDGWPEFAPVDALAPNPFGLHHVHGNVGEWTAEDYVPDEAREAFAGPALKTVRGGSFRSSVRDLRSASRSGVPPENRYPEIGVRPARAVDG